MQPVLHICNTGASGADLMGAPRSQALMKNVTEIGQLRMLRSA
jgi:hypothetical protein